MKLKLRDFIFAVIFRKHTKFDDINFKLINFTDADHLMLLKEMGISYEFTNDNRIVLHHNPEKVCHRDL
jgi:hypothetical protein